MKVEKDSSMSASSVPILTFFGKVTSCGYTVTVHVSARVSPEFMLTDEKVFSNQK